MTKDFMIAAIVRHGTDVLLTRLDTEEEEESWGLPTTRVEERELPPEALMRALRNDLGLEVEVTDLIYLAQLETPGNESLTTVIAFKADELTEDDEKARLESKARFVVLGDALSLLLQHSTRFMAEPITSYLVGEVGEGSAWFYRREADGEDRLIARYPPDLMKRGKLPALVRRPVAPVVETPEYERRRNIVVLGCLILLLALVALIVVGIIALAHKG